MQPKLTIQASPAGSSTITSSAVRPDGKIVLVTSEQDSEVTAVDTATLTVVANVPTGPRPRGIVFTRDGLTAFVSDELGGRVVIPPFDAPWVRLTVITDPQGATFTASKFVPENTNPGSDVDPTFSAAA